MEKYSRVKQLGKGSFGAAFLVKRIKDGGLFVVKEVSLAKMTSKEKDEARHEVKVLSQLSHPNITQYVEHVERNGVLSIVMEYADAGDLYQRIKASAAAKYSRNRAPPPSGGGGQDEVYEGMLKSRGPGASGMSEDLMMHYFSQICLAIDYLHSKHILHRDIKSMNVFLTSRGTVKLGDFGISTILRNTIGMAKTVCGTPYYFSPELCRSKPYNNKSDVWALGIVLYEMANVKHPFDASSMSALMQRICKGMYVALPTAPTNNPSLGFTKGFNALIARCLDVNVGTRYNIKQVLATDILRQALARLEKDLMLATVCKVRLQTVIGHFDQREPSSYQQQQQQPQGGGALPAISNPSSALNNNNNNPSAFPNINNRLGPKPMIAGGVGVPLLGQHAPPPRPIPIPTGATPRAAIGIGPVRSEAVQVQKEIEKVDKLIAYLKQPTPGGGPYKVAVPQPPSQGQPQNLRASPPSAAVANAKEKDREEATNEYIRKHHELQQIMAAHKKKVEDNLRRRQEQEEAYHREALAKRHQYQVDNRPKPVDKPKLNPAQGGGGQLQPLPPVRDQSPPPVPKEEVRLPPIASKLSPIAPAANCLPANPVVKKTRQAAAAEALVAEQKRQDARKKAAAEERRAKMVGIKASPAATPTPLAPPTAPQRPIGDDAQGIGEYFDRRRREQEKEKEKGREEGLMPLGKADMPAGVMARRQLLGDKASPVPTSEEQGGSRSPPVMRPKVLAPIATNVAVMQAEPPSERPPPEGDRRPSIGRHPSVHRELPPIALPQAPLPQQKRPTAAGVPLTNQYYPYPTAVQGGAVEAQVKSIEEQLKALEQRPAPPRLSRPAASSALAPVSSSNNEILVRTPSPSVAPPSTYVANAKLQAIDRLDPSSLGLDVLARSFHRKAPADDAVPRETAAYEYAENAVPETTASEENRLEDIDDDDHEEQEAQTLRQKDYGNMLKHIQGLTVMLGELDRRNHLNMDARARREEGGMDDRESEHLKKVERGEVDDDEEEVATEIIISNAQGGPGAKAKLSPTNYANNYSDDDDGDDFVEEEVIDTSCYIGRGRARGSDDSEDSYESDDASSNSDDSEDEVDTILDATVRGAVSSTEFGDVEPLTPSRKKAAKGNRAGGDGVGAGGRGAPLSYGDDEDSPRSSTAGGDGAGAGAVSGGEASLYFRLAHLCGVHFDGQSPVTYEGKPLPLMTPSYDDNTSTAGAQQPLDKATMAKISAALIKYVMSEKLYAAISEASVTPKDKPSEGPRYRKEAATFVGTLVLRLLNSIGEEDDGTGRVISHHTDEKRDDMALDCARRLLQLLHAVPPGGASSASVALTSLLSGARRALPVPPSYTDDRTALSSVPQNDKQKISEVLRANDSYIKGLCSLILSATNGEGPRSVRVASESEDAYFADEINDIIGGLSQALYFKYAATAISHI